MKTTMLTSGRGLISLVALVLVGGTGCEEAQKGTKPAPQQEQKESKPATQEESYTSASMYDASSSDVLKGLQEVWVLVEDLPDGAKKIGLTRDRIRAATEVSLRRRGVPVLPLKEGATKGGPYLYVCVRIVGSAFNVDIALAETVRRERDHKTLVLSATTWTKGNTGTTGGNADYIVKDLKEIVDEFCLDYLKANPK